MAGLELDDVYRVKNLDDHPIVLRWNKKQTVIEPGQERAFNVGGIINAFGDWRAKEDSYMGRVHPRDPNSSVTQIPSRQQEIDRLASYWFVNPTNKDGSENPLAGNDPAVLVQRVAKVEITDLDGNVITQVLHDPQGEGFVSRDAAASDAEEMRSELRRAMARVRALEEMMKEQNGPPLQAPDSVQEDAPPQILATALQTSGRKR